MYRIYCKVKRYISLFLKIKSMKYIHHPFKIAFLLLLIVLAGSCEKDYYFTPPPPPSSDQTTTLEAAFVSTPPTTINSSYWKTADYLKVNATDVSTNNLYGDGLLNMTGSYLGVSSFNNGVDPGLKIKAAYDNDNLYILAEWTDKDLDLSDGSWLRRGPVDPLKADSTSGWTSQRNSDRIAFAFEVNAASSPAGSFSNVGCAASCHSNGNNKFMYPTSGTVDFWNWSAAKTNPMGYAEDMIANSDSLSDDSGQRIFYRNTNGTTDRSGPAYEWDGSSQTVTLPNGQSSILDPGYYIKNKTPFIGDAARGDSIYNRTSPPGDCSVCHGDRGQGGTEGAINQISQNKKSRNALMLSMSFVADMGPYWGTLSPGEKDDVIAYLRGLSGVPGYYLNTPDGSNADIKASSNLTPIDITNAMLPATNKHTLYQVLFVRKLKTNNADDIQFDKSTSSNYTFGVALMDNDGINHIGSAKETLTLK
jgi:mono/diheme cytochrome c family protein